MPKPDVLIFIHSLGVGGTEIFLAATLPRLVNSGLNVTVVTWGQLDQAKELARGGVEILCLKGGRFSKFVGCCAILRTNPDAVAHFYLPEAYLIAGLAGVVTRHKRMIMSRRSLNVYQHRHPWLARIERYLHGKMTVILANSNAVEDELILEGAPSERVHTIYSGI